MGINGAGWVDWAHHVLPEVAPEKRYSEPNEGRGFVWHSHEGTGLQSLIDIMNGPRRTSFMFWINRAGELYQFAPVTASVWCSGSKVANIKFWPVELEGFAPVPINDAQLACAQRLTADWEAHSGLRAKRLDTMWEHNEVSIAPTACPGGRYDRWWQMMAQEEDDMTADQVRAIILDWSQSQDFTDAVLRVLRDNGYSITTERYNEVAQDRMLVERVANSVSADLVARVADYIRSEQP